MARDVPLLAVVDDDADVSAALTWLVSSDGFAVETVASGTEFLLSVADREPDCVRLDLHMPDLRGFDVQNALARGHAAIPVVVITGHGIPGPSAWAIQMGAKGYLRNPVNDGMLLETIERWPSMARHNRTDERYLAC
jgi:FixJ family two-component response regulator